MVRMTVGVIFAAWQTEDYLPRSLGPWIEARARQLGGHQFKIAAVSVPFEGFEQPVKLDDTRPILGWHLHDGTIDHLITSDKPMRETEARGAALRWLVDQGCDILWLADSDEFITLDHITRILAFLEANPFTVWLRLSLRNAVFSPDQYLTEPFTPPRVFRVRAGGYCAHSFYDDNGVTYGGTITRDLLRDDHFPSMTVPASMAWIPHLSWLSDSRGRAKVRYQEARWNPPHGAGCSFAWDETTNQLVWNLDYFKRTGQPIPEVARLTVDAVMSSPLDS